MTEAQYLRTLNCIVGTNAGEGLNLAEFRVSFQVHRGDFQTPNSADVRIYNLSRDTAALIGTKEFTQLVLQAGYGGNVAQIFQGGIKQVRQGRIDQKDSYVDITAADGDEAYNFASVIASIAGGSTPQNHVEVFLQHMFDFEIKRGGAPTFPKRSLPRGHVFYGSAKDQLREFAAWNDCTWSIQDNFLTFQPLSGANQTAIVELTPDSGLIGVPEQTQNGLQVRALLNPLLRIGTIIRIESDINRLRLGLDTESVGANKFLLQTTAKANADSLYYVMVANHSGDTRGNHWYTDMTCLAVDAEIPIDAARQVAVIPAGFIPRY